MATLIRVGQQYVNLDWVEQVSVQFDENGRLAKCLLHMRPVAVKPERPPRVFEHEEAVELAAALDRLISEEPMIRSPAVPDVEVVDDPGGLADEVERGS